MGNGALPAARGLRRLDLPANMRENRNVHITACTMQVRLPGCHSLKEKRGLLQPLLSALRREFALAAAEVDAQEAWESAVVVFVAVSNDAAHNQRVLQSALHWAQTNRPDLEIVSTAIEER